MSTVRLVRSAAPARWLLAASTACRIANLVASAALLAVPAWTVGVFATGGDPSVAGVVVAMVLIALAQGTLRYLEQWLGHLAAFRILAGLRSQLFEALAPQAPAATDADDSGPLLELATSGIDRIEVFYAHTLAPAVAAVVVPVAGVVVATVQGGPAAGATVAVAAGATMVTGVAGRGRMRAAEARASLARTRLSQDILDDVRGRTDLRIFGAQEQRAVRVDEAGSDLAAAGIDAGRVVAARRGVLTVVLPAAILLLTAAVAPAVMDGRVPFGSLLVCLAILPAVLVAAGGIEAFMTSLPSAVGAARDLWRVLDAVPVVTDPATPLVLPAVSAGGTRGRELAFAGVGFSYPGRDRPALSCVDLVIPAGARVAVVGVSGSGKSTLARLAVRVWDPDHGQVSLDGVPLDRLPLATVRRTVGLVDQRPVLFSGTVAENLRLADPDADDADLDRVLALVRLDLADRDGLGTRLGPRGAGLSGGQAQRLVLARTLLRRPDVLIMDEATAHQDPVTEAELAAAIAAGHAGTLLVLAHRLSTLRTMDEIVVVEQGGVVERGTFSDLVAARGHFAALVDQLDIGAGPSQAPSSQAPSSQALSSRTPPAPGR